MSEFQIYSPGSISKRSAHSPAQKSSPSPNRYQQDLSPTNYDAEFYRRKALRLEEDVQVLGDELNKARLRLRRAEDFQLKYGVILKQKVGLEEVGSRRQKQMQELSKQKELLLLKLQEKGDKAGEAQFQKQRYVKDIALWKEKAVQAEQRCKTVTIEEETRASQRIEKELSFIKKRYGEAEEHYKSQIAKLNKQLKEGQNMDGTDQRRQLREERQAKEREEEIKRLEDNVQNMREEHLKMMDEKNGEISRVKDKFKELMDSQLGNIHKNMGNQDQKFKTELQGLKAMLEIKNEDIQNLQKQLKIALEEQTKNHEEHNLDVELLKEKLHQQERQSDGQLFNLKQRLDHMHEADVSTMKNHYDQLAQGLRDERRELEKLIEEKNEKVDFERRQFERAEGQFKATVEDRERQIATLRHKLESTGQSNFNEVGSLRQTLNKFSDQKQTLSNEYQSNIAFLNQQITKLTASNELKNNQIRQLHEYNAILKQDHFQAVKDLEARWKAQRKEREAEREKERDRREKVEEEFRDREKEWKSKERELEMEVDREKRERLKWQANCEKLQKENERLYKQIGQLQNNCKNQFSKNQSTVIQGGGSKRTLMTQLQRQKGDFEAIKRMEVDQVKKKYELEIVRLTNANEKLQNQLSSKKIDYEKLEEELRKLGSQHKNIDKLNRDKLADYSKKMSSLNSEILLTQNLYQSLINAKSKVARKQ